MLKNRVLLEGYHSPGELEHPAGAIIEHDNHRPYHESLGQVTPIDGYRGHAATGLRKRENINRHTLEQGRINRRLRAA